MMHGSPYDHRETEQWLEAQRATCSAQIFLLDAPGAVPYLFDVGYRCPSSEGQPGGAIGALASVDDHWLCES